MKWFTSRSVQFFLLVSFSQPLYAQAILSEKLVQKFDELFEKTPSCQKQNKHSDESDVIFDSERKNWTYIISIQDNDNALVYTDFDNNSKTGSAITINFMSGIVQKWGGEAGKPPIDCNQKQSASLCYDVLQNAENLVRKVRKHVQENYRNNLTSQEIFDEQIGQADCFMTLIGGFKTGLLEAFKPNSK